MASGLHAAPDARARSSSGLPLATDTDQPAYALPSIGDVHIERGKSAPLSLYGISCIHKKSISSQKLSCYAVCVFLYDVDIYTYNIIMVISVTIMYFYL
jgi:hypothetical protein